MNNKQMFCARINKELYKDATRLKNLEGNTSSINKYIDEGLRHVIDVHLKNLSVQRKKRETLNAIYGQ